MIYLITGVPGSGKTLYAVSTLVKQLAAEKVKDKKGNERSRRVLVDGIPDLLIPHDVMATITEDDKGVQIAEGDSVLNWPRWCKPGDVIVIDEVQRLWRPRGMNTKPPEMIKALETHRHMGVDFVIVTQNPMLIDQNVRRLIGRHQHIRRLLGMQRAIIYDWDGCSVDVHRTKSATTSFWNYPKSAYALYKSSELHTKQKQKIPAFLLIPLLAIVGFVFVAPKAFGVMSGSMSGKGISTPMVSASAPTASASSVAVAGPLPAVSSPAVSSVSQSAIAGCISVHDRCSCLDTSGKPVEAEITYCHDQTGHDRPPALQLTTLDSPPVYVDLDPGIARNFAVNKVVFDLHPYAKNGAGGWYR